MFKKNFSSADTKIGKNKSLFSLILVLVFLFVGIMLGHFLNLFLPKINNVPITKYQTEKKEVKNTLFENSFNWQLPSSDLIAFTYIKKGSEGIKDELISFSPDTKSSVNTKFLLKSCCGGSKNYGSSDPLILPNGLYTLYIGVDNYLHIFSHSSLEDTKIPASNFVEYISGVSPDSTKIVYYASEDSIKTRAEGYGGASDLEKFEIDKKSGFYLFDLNTGDTTLLYPLTSFVGFIDNNKILSQIDTYDNKVKYVVFNTLTFEADYNQVKGEFGSIQTGPFSFSPDGKWAYLYSPSSTDTTESGSQVVYGNFPLLPDYVIEKGNWADFQHPLISPDGNIVAYAKLSSRINGSVTYDAWTYNSVTKKSIQVSLGQPLNFLGPNKLVSEGTDESKNLPIYYIYDFDTKEVTTVN